MVTMCDRRKSAPHDKDTVEGHAPVLALSTEKSPRHCCLGLNPPMEEVEETTGSDASVVRVQRLD
jgi:hypothetical protein